MLTIFNNYNLITKDERQYNTIELIGLKML